MSDLGSNSRLSRVDAYRLFQAGSEALAAIERAGMRVDVEYVREKLEWLDGKIEQSRRRLERKELGTVWQRRFEGKTNWNSPHQLRAVLYDDLKVKPFKMTESDEEGTDEESLRQVEVDGVVDLLRLRRLNKVKNVLIGFDRYQVDGFLHPSFSLHTVQTYRSCVAKGSKVLVARDFLTHPDGVPIEDVRVGDYVYCFDDALRPALKKVLWTGKTGHRKVVRLHWSERGNHGSGHLDVTPEHLIRLVDGTYEEAQRMLGKRGVPFVSPGPVRNPYGRGGIPGNHMITRVEWLDEAVDVYDIEVEDCHNFIANEICVHNSSSDPNMQNVPSRDPESMFLCRRAIVPRLGHAIMEIDFKGIEVSVACCYHKDPRMREYLLNPKSNMHGDMARQIFWLPESYQPQKGDNFSEILRQSAKNGFVFPQFYGDWYESCAFNIAFTWCKMPRSGRWKATDGLNFRGEPIGRIMLENGMSSLEDFAQHMKRIEDDFWNNRFKVYNRWRKKWHEEYQRNGRFEMKTGFVCSGYMQRNQVINYPVQGAAFHCLLKVLVELERRIRGWKSKIIGEIHDSTLIDYHPDEFEDLVKLCHYLCSEWLLEQWSWIDVPMNIEIKTTKVDGDWSDTEEVKWPLAA